MRQAVCLILIAALCASSFPFFAFAEDPTSAPPTEEPVHGEVLLDEEPGDVALPLFEEPLPTEQVFETLSFGDSQSAFLIDQDDASQDIEFPGAAGFRPHELAPAPIYTAKASGLVTNVQIYLARNVETSDTPLSGKWLFITLRKVGEPSYTCSLLQANEEGGEQERENFAAIPVGDAASVQLITFSNPGSNCEIEEGASYEVLLSYRVPGDPRWTNGTIYTKGADTSSSLFLKVSSTDPVDPQEECSAPCASNVLFLPGIKGSRLYIDEGSEEKVWDPLGEQDIRSLFLDASGVSEKEVYAKTGDIIDSVASFVKIYAGFIDSMDKLVSDGTIQDWRAVPYDWRLSLSDIVTNGSERDGKIYYGEATSTPYIEQTLRSLAATSKTGKVTIVAHSNGGLVAKALFQKLGSETTAELVDNVVFVGVPQAGAPQAIGALLFGFKEGLPWWFPFMVSPATAREMAERSPMGYHLLPTEHYFDSIAGDPTHAVVRFDNSEKYAAEYSAYGETIDDFEELAGFLKASDNGRTKPSSEDFGSANVLDSFFLNYAASSHAEIDTWLPPEGVTLYQIAGWGEDTISGIEFYEECGIICTKKYRPIFVEDGDGVVPVPSALMLSTENKNVKRYWLNIQDYNKDNSDKDHGSFLEIENVQSFILNTLLNTTAEIRFIQDNSIPSQSETKRLRFFLHSPLTLELYDKNRNKTGPEPDGSKKEEVPGTIYGRFGDVQYISAPAGNEYRIEMHGTGVGTFSIDVQETNGNGVEKITTLANLPTSAETYSVFTIKDGAEDASPLEVDEDGDGTVDIVLAMVDGETNFYSPSIKPEKMSGNAGNVKKDKGSETPQYLSPTITSTPIPTPDFFNDLVPAHPVSMKTETNNLPTTTLKIEQTASVYNSVGRNWYEALTEILIDFVTTIRVWFNFLLAKITA